MSEVKAENSGNQNERTHPLIRETPAASEIDQKKSTSQEKKPVKKTLKSTNDLANHLPTGTLLLYHLFSPIVTEQGHCHTFGRILTAMLVSFCGILCFLSCFTDSYKDKNGTVSYGLATIRGLWVIDESEPLSPEEASSYKLQLMDFVHAFMTLLVFGSVALSDSNVMGCFYPMPSVDTHWMHASLPGVIGAFCSTLFVLYPTKRHGLGFPVS